MAVVPLLAGISTGGNLFGGLFGGRAKSKGYLKTLVASDFQSSTVTVSKTTDFTKLGEYTVPAKQLINLGFGNPNQPMNQAYLYVVSKDTSDSAYEGMFRIVVADANERTTDVVMEERSDQLSGDANDKSKKIAFPEVVDYPYLGRAPSEDDLIQIYLKADATGIWSWTYSTVNIPVTVRTL